MAKMVTVLPDKEIKAFERMNIECDEFLGNITKAGAKVAAANMKSHVPVPAMASKVKTSKTYKTPSDGGINTQAYISGYIPFSDPSRKYFSRRGGNGTMYHTKEGVPADFLAKVFEYGRKSAPFPKKPFVRASFTNNNVKSAMETEQNKAIEKYWGSV